MLLEVVGLTQPADCERLRIVVVVPVDINCGSTDLAGLGVREGDASHLACKTLHRCKWVGASLGLMPPLGSQIPGIARCS
nr:MetaGeneMark_Unknown Function [uncultured bacterium]